ncbi:MAG: hypothetical protein IMY74_08105 [Bacteroidetes bacterium]|jgi:hypothetical protein|nr:hypothetical protein [Bacteroidota bacterium]
MKRTQRIGIQLSLDCRRFGVSYMKKCKLGAIIGAIWGLLGSISIIITPSHEYVGLSHLNMTVFLPIYICIVGTYFVLYLIFSNGPLPNSVVSILSTTNLFPIYGALIGAGIGYLIEKYRK